MAKITVGAKTSSSKGYIPEVDSKANFFLNPNMEVNKNGIYGDPDKLLGLDFANPKCWNGNSDDSRYNINSSTYNGIGKNYFARVSTLINGGFELTEIFTPGVGYSGGEMLAANDNVGSVQGAVSIYYYTNGLADYIRALNNGENSTVANPSKFFQHVFTGGPDDMNVRYPTLHAGGSNPLYQLVKNIGTPLARWGDGGFSFQNYWDGDVQDYIYPTVGIRIPMQLKLNGPIYGDQFISPKLSGANYMTAVALNYPESNSSYGSLASRQGLTPGFYNLSGSKKYDASRSLHLWVWNHNTNDWIPDEYFSGLRLNGHCYDLYSSGGSAGEQAGLFVNDYTTISDLFKNCTYIVMGSHRDDTRTSAVKRILFDLGMPKFTPVSKSNNTGVQYSPEYILVGKPGSGSVDKYLTTGSPNVVRAQIAKINNVWVVREATFCKSYSTSSYGGYFFNYIMNARDNDYYDGYAKTWVYGNARTPTATDVSPAQVSFALDQGIGAIDIGGAAYKTKLTNNDIPLNHSIEMWFYCDGYQVTYDTILWSMGAKTYTSFSPPGAFGWNGSSWNNYTTTSGSYGAIKNNINFTPTNLLQSIQMGKLRTWMYYCCTHSYDSVTNTTKVNQYYNLSTNSSLYNTSTTRSGSRLMSTTYNPSLLIGGLDSNEVGASLAEKGVFSGKIGLFNVYTRELSNEEVTRNYNATRSRYSI